MSTPYALSIHEDHLKTCLALLERAALCPVGTADNTVLARAHNQIEKATGGSFDADHLAQLATIRLMRNCTIHTGGRASQSLLNQLTTWSASTEAGWLKIAKRSPRGMQLGDRVTFGHGEMILVLAVTKALDREANGLLQTALPRSLWADLVVEDLIQEYPSAPRASDSLRKARGMARIFIRQ